MHTWGNMCCMTCPLGNHLGHWFGIRRTLCRVARLHTSFMSLQFVLGWVIQTPLEPIYMPSPRAVPSTGGAGLHAVLVLVPCMRMSEGTGGRATLSPVVQDQ